MCVCTHVLLYVFENVNDCSMPCASIDFISENSHLRINTMSRVKVGRSFIWTNSILSTQIYEYILVCMTNAWLIVFTTSPGRKRSMFKSHWCDSAQVLVCSIHEHICCVHRASVSRGCLLNDSYTLQIKALSTQVLKIVIWSAPLRYPRILQITISICDIHSSISGQSQQLHMQCGFIWG